MNNEYEVKANIPNIEDVIDIMMEPKAPNGFRTTHNNIGRANFCFSDYQTKNKNGDKIVDSNSKKRMQRESAKKRHRKSR